MLIPLLLFLGCVSKGDYELIQVQLDATRTALSAKNASCYEGLAQRDAQVAALERELEAARGRLDALDERHQQLLTEVESGRAALAELVTTCTPQSAPEPGPRRRRGVAPPLPPEPLTPLVQATVDEVQEALALRSRNLYELEQEQAAYEAWAAAFAPLIEDGRVTLHKRHARTLVRVPTVQLFNEGRVSISPRGEQLLEALGQTLAGSDGMAIQVAAHTDNLPVHTAEHESSWELCFDQALAVVRALEEAGVPARLSAAAYAGEYPIASNDDAEGRKVNRRIELTIAPVVGEAVAPAEVPEPAPAEPTPPAAEER